MKSRKTNSILFILSLVFLALPMACQKKESKIQSGDDSEGIIADLERMKKDVNHRKARQLVWKKAEEGGELARYDAVRTGDESNASIRYWDNARVEMEENTLLVVVDRKGEAQRKRAIMALPEGKIQGRISGGSAAKDHSLVVKTRAGWVVADGKQNGPVSFSTHARKDGEIEVTAEEGEVRVEIREEGKKTPVIRKVRQKETFRAKVAPLDKTAKENTNSGWIESEEPIALTKKEKITVRIAKRPEPMPEPKSKVAAREPKSEWPAKPNQMEKKEPENEFKITSPASGSSQSDSSVAIQGILSGSYQVYLNGREIKSSGGEFKEVVNLNPGLNVFTFQVIGPKKDQVRYETLEIVRN